MNRRCPGKLTPANPRHKSKWIWIGSRFAAKPSISSKTFMRAAPMTRTDWPIIIKASADPARVRSFLNSSAETRAFPRLDKFPVDSKRALAALVSGSQYLGELLTAQPALLSVFDFEELRHPRRADGLRREVKRILEQKLAVCDYAEALSGLRRFKQRETLRVAARDL